jgi:probable selenium-dependent hydroxylase accessory protein YqeC
VGAGGKSTAMKRIGSVLAQSGVKVRMTTTTRVGVEEFSEYRVVAARGRAEVLQALRDSEPVLLLSAGLTAEGSKHVGVNPDWLEGLRLPADAVMLVEADGARKRPMKAPGPSEPVIPAASATVSALMGASAFDEPVDEAHCYNHEKALALLGRTGSFFEPAQIAALAADEEGLRKGVSPGMAFRVLVNQGDVPDKRDTAWEALRIMKERYGIDGALVSFQEREWYGANTD